MREEGRQARRMILTPSGDSARPFRVGRGESGRGEGAISPPDEMVYPPHPRRPTDGRTDSDAVH